MGAVTSIAEHKARKGHKRPQSESLLGELPRALERPLSSNSSGRAVVTTIESARARQKKREEQVQIRRWRSVNVGLHTRLANDIILPVYETLSSTIHPKYQLLIIAQSASPPHPSTNPVIRDEEDSCYKNVWLVDPDIFCRASQDIRERVSAWKITVEVISTPEFGLIASLRDLRVRASKVLFPGRWSTVEFVFSNVTQGPSDLPTEHKRLGISGTYSTSRLKAPFHPATLLNDRLLKERICEIITANFRSFF